MLLRRNDNYNRRKLVIKIINKVLIVNGLTMLFSGTLFGYFTYNAIK